MVETMTTSTAGNRLKATRPAGTHLAKKGAGALTGTRRPTKPKEGRACQE